MPFADHADEELVGIVVVIPVRAVGIEEEEPWVIPDERVEEIEHDRDPVFPAKTGGGEDFVAVPHAVTSCRSGACRNYLTFRNMP